MSLMNALISTIIDLTFDDYLEISGNLAHPGMSAELRPSLGVADSIDGIADFDLLVTVKGGFHAQVVVPFAVRAPLAQVGGRPVSGVRLHIHEAGAPARTMALLMLQKVDSFTSVSSNSLMIRGASYDARTHQLVVDVTYGGGCLEHSFALEWDGTVLKSDPPQFPVNIVDRTPPDSCRAMIDQQLRFDLSLSDIRGNGTLLLSTPGSPRAIWVEMRG